MISVHFQDKPFNIMVIQAYAPTSNSVKEVFIWVTLNEADTQKLKFFS